MKNKQQKEFIVDISFWSAEIKVKAANAREAKKKARAKLKAGGITKYINQVYADEF